MLLEYVELMLDKLPSVLPPRRHVDHRIELEEGARPPAKALYCLFRLEMIELKRQLIKIIEVGYL